MRARILQAIGACLLALVFAALPPLVPAQTSILQGIKVKDFSMPGDYFDPPHQFQMKSLVQGAEAQPLDSERYLIHQLKLTIFRPDGERDVLVRAPECVYDTTRREASSSGHLDVRTADGVFFLEGDGFLWRQTNSDLIISNNVHTIIQNLPLKSSAP
ncbi:MAG TPA: hypothetical protein VKA67_13210 [Verrucomicrobiae bacterium]|nr:hypothetical protein [Verrucomicrobiae bacterium]